MRWGGAGWCWTPPRCPDSPSCPAPEATGPPRTKKAVLLDLYRAHPGYGDRSTASRVAELAGSPGAQVEELANPLAGGPGDQHMHAAHLCITCQCARMLRSSSSAVPVMVMPLIACQRGYGQANAVHRRR